MRRTARPYTVTNPLPRGAARRGRPIDGDGYADIGIMLGGVRQAGLLGTEWDERWAAAIGS